MIRQPLVQRVVPGPAMRARQVLTAHLAGSKFLEVLPGYSGSVLAVVSTAAYLLGDNDELLWIAGEGTPMHQRCVHVSPDLAGLEAGMEFWTEDHRLMVGNVVALDVGRAPRWEPPTVGRGAPLERVTACFRCTLAAVQSFRQVAGLAPMIALVAATADRHRLPALDRMNPLLARVREPIGAIALASQQGDLDAIAKHCRSLIGLGPGLTPSGDDFIGGLFFTVQCLAAAYPERFCRDQQVVDVLMDWASTRTNLISYSILRDMVRGQGPEPLHQLLIALLNDCEPYRALAAVNQLIRIGHSSGWDMLAGALTGMLITTS